MHIDASYFYTSNYVFMKKVFQFLSLIALFFVTNPLLAQVKEEAAQSKKLVEEISAFEFLMKGGVFLIPIAILLFYSLVVIVEKVRYITRMGKLNPNLLLEIRSDLQQGDTRKVLETLSRDQTAFGSVVREGVLTASRPIQEVESNLEKMANIEIGRMEAKIAHLGLVAGVAPTLGFIGTISGVIKIFYSISITENVSIGNISGGLYEKMISSGAGLIVGIIAFTGYHLLNGMIDRYALSIQKINLEFVNLIQRPDGN
jgi:biopolymer transport protein ExbB